MVYDVAIIGTGPAGLSAALNLKIHQKSILWFGARSLSDKIGKAEEILNYPGLPAISGEKLAEAFRKQVEDMNLAIEERMVNNIMPFGEHFAVTAGSDFYEAKTVILASGIAYAALMQGEAEYLGRGVSYCATCDGNLYKGKNIAVLCNNKRFEAEVAFLAELANQVYYFPQYADPLLHHENVRMVSERPMEILGEKKVTGIKLRDGNSVIVDGVFCLRDSIALSTLLPGLETEEGHIKVNRQMETGIPGVFAAGDCTGRPYQYAKAIGEGNVAAHSVIDYLATRGIS